MDSLEDAKLFFREVGEKERNGPVPTTAVSSQIDDEVLGTVSLQFGE